MTSSEIISELSRIRSASHCRSQGWMEAELSRLIAKLEREEVEEELLIELIA